MATNLPARVTKVGGALERAITNLEAYVEDKRPLSRVNQIALARVIEERPALNTEARVALLIDAFSYHEVDRRAEFMRIVDTNGLEVTYLALDFLYEIGYDERSENWRKRPLMELIRDVASCIELFRECELEVTETSTVERLVEQLGGLEAAINANLEDMQKCLLRSEEDE